MLPSIRLEIRIAKKIAQHRIKKLKFKNKGSQGVVALAYNIVNELEVYDGTVR